MSSSTQEEYHGGTPLPCDVDYDFIIPDTVPLRLSATVIRRVGGRRQIKIRRPKLASFTEDSSLAITCSLNPTHSVPAFLLPEEINCVGHARKRNPIHGKNTSMRAAAKSIARSVAREALSTVMDRGSAKASISLLGRSMRNVSGRKQKARNVAGSRQQRAATADTNKQMRGFSNPRSFFHNNRLVCGPETNKWITSFMSPFAQSVKAVGLPRPGSSPSYKTTGYVRGTGYIGEGGVGYVYFMPSLANDRPVVGYTTAVYNQNMLAQFNSGSPVASQTGNAVSPCPAYMTNLPYSAATLSTANNSVEGRIVSCSLKVEYTGTTLNKSGQFYACVEPNFTAFTGTDHGAAAPGNGVNMAQLGTRDATEISNVASSRSARIVLIPPQNNMWDYPIQTASAWRKIYPFCDGQLQWDGSTSQSFAAIMISGVAGESFYFEAITHVEYIGPLVAQNNLTESISNVLGFDTVSCALQRAQRNIASSSGMNLSKAIRKELNKEGVQFKLC